MDEPPTKAVKLTKRGCPATGGASQPIPGCPADSGGPEPLYRRILLFGGGLVVVP